LNCQFGISSWGGTRKQAFELLSQILEDTQNTDKNLIGFRPNKNEKKETKT
jgi:hypothetical protein